MSVESRVVPPLEIASSQVDLAEFRLRGAIAAELLATDQFVMPDRPMSEEVRDAWQVYRQQLRDLSKLPGTSADKWAAWPSRPDGKAPNVLAAPLPPATPSIPSQPPVIGYEEWLAGIKT